MDQKLLEELKKTVKGDVVTDDVTLTSFSHDASLFEVKPQVVVYPKDVEDIKALVTFVNKHKKDHQDLSLTGRAAGTDMGGGSINDSITVAFQKYFMDKPVVHGSTATVEPGVFYRDFEKETLKHGLIFPSYPASRELCAMGGIVNNNSGGEKSLEYGKTERYVEEVHIVLSDGNEYVFGKLTEPELKQKMSQNNFEGRLYRETFRLVADNYDLLQDARPKVSKNSAGYYLWNVYDREKKTFDFAKLIVGAQGTLGLVTKAKIKLVPVKKYSEMIVIFLNNLDHLGEIINDVLPLKPESFEAYDDHTLKLAIKYFREFAKQLGAKNTLETAWHFLPEFMMILTGGIPKLVLQVEFTGDVRHEIYEKIEGLRAKLKPFQVKMSIAPTKKAAQKYWLIRRESFNLLRKKIKDKHTAPFIDDFAVRPEYLPEFLPKLNALFTKYPSLIYTVAGHVGDGNFHIIPLMTIEDPDTKKIIPELGKKVYDLVLAYHGTITAEHNDGLVRTPYLEQMYGKKVYDLFRQTKKIFDPEGIFNPRKKIGGTMEYALSHIREHW